MTKNRKMIIALSILASGVSLFFSSPVLAGVLEPKQSCSAAKHSSDHKHCGCVAVNYKPKMRITFRVEGASWVKEVCFGGQSIYNQLCTLVNGHHHLDLDCPYPATTCFYRLDVWAHPGGGGKVIIETIEGMTQAPFPKMCLD